MRSADEIVDLFHERRRLRGSQINTAHEIRDAYNGQIALPLPDGAENETVAFSDPRAAETPVGALGTSAGVTSSEGSDAGPVPTSLVAVTVKV